MTHPYQTKTTYPKESIIEPKLVLLNTQYTFSINPNDDYQFWKEIGSERKKKAVNHMRHIMRLYPNIDMDVYMDISRTGRIHWHGTVRFMHNNHVMYFYEEITHMLLLTHTLDIGPIQDPHEWLKYCMKTYHLWPIELHTADVIKTKVLHNKNRLQKPIDEY